MQDNFLHLEDGFAITMFEFDYACTRSYGQTLDSSNCIHRFKNMEIMKVKYQKGYFCQQLKTI